MEGPARTQTCCDASTKELDVIFENAGIGIAFVKNRKLVRVNRVLAQLYGGSPGELVGRETSIIYHSQEDFERYGERLYSSLRSGSVVVEEVPGRDRLGNPKWMRVTGKALNPDDPHEGSIWIVEDITDQKALTEAMERRDAILEAVSQMSGLLLASKDFLPVMPEFLERIGEAAGAHRTGLYHLPDGQQGPGALRAVAMWSIPAQLDLDPASHTGVLEPFIQANKAVLAQGKTVQLAAPALSKADRQSLDSIGVKVLCLVPVRVGVEIWGLLALENCDDERIWSSAELDGFKIAANVISSAIWREQYEQHRRLQEFKYSAIVENARSIILRMDPSGRILFMNRFGLEFFGFDSDQLMGKNVVGTIVPEVESTGRNLRALIDELLHAPDAHVKGENENIKADGTRVWISWTNTPVRNSKGELEEILSIGHDITQLKELERRLREASEAKSAFLATVSHEVRTPLNAIIGMANLVAETELDQEQKKYVAAINHAANTLLLLINDILDLAKIEAGRQSLEEHEFDVVSLIEETVAMFAPMAMQKGINLYCRFSLSIPRTVVGDAQKLGQILRNLLNNGIKFTENGHVYLRCNVAEERDNETVLRFDVEDTGIGIPREKLDSIFEPFTQSDPSITRKYGGTGLGLSIVKHLVELMGGEVGVSSDPGKGSRFWVTLPFSQASHSTPWAQLALGGTCTRAIVAVEDDVLRGILAATLGEAGLSPIALKGRDGLDGALSRLREECVDSPPFLMFDASLVDSRLRLLLEELKAQTQWCIRPIIVSNRSSDRAPLEILSQFPVLILSAPIFPSQLLDALSYASRGTFQPGGEKGEDKDFDMAESPAAKVLVVEDSEMNRLLVKTMLEKMGHEVVTASNGVEGLELLSRKRFDLVLLDIQMPELDGLSTVAVIRSCEQGREIPEKHARLSDELLAALRERLHGRHLPVVAMTAHAFAEDRQRSLDAGMDGHIVKPFVPRQLRQVINRILSRNRQEAVPQFKTEPGALPSIKRHLEEKYGLPHESVDRFIEISVLSIKESLAKGWEAVGRGDWDTLNRCFHTLKNSFATLGLAEEAETAKAAEQAARKKEAIEYGKMLRRLEEGLQAVETAAAKQEA